MTYQREFIIGSEHDLLPIAVTVDYSVEHHDGDYDTPGMSKTEILHISNTGHFVIDGVNDVSFRMTPEMKSLLECTIYDLIDELEHE